MGSGLFANRLSAHSKSFFCFEIPEQIMNFSPQKVCVHSPWCLPLKWNETTAVWTKGSRMSSKGHSLYLRVHVLWKRRHNQWTDVGVSGRPELDYPPISLSNHWFVDHQTGGLVFRRTLSKTLVAPWHQAFNAFLTIITTSVCSTSQESPTTPALLIFIMSDGLFLGGFLSCLRDVRGCEFLQIGLSSSSHQVHVESIQVVSSVIFCLEILLCQAVSACRKSYHKL